MTVSVRVFDADLPADVAHALAGFEAGFRYPLGEGATFCISHGEDYRRFFRAMGESVCIVSERDGFLVALITGGLLMLAAMVLGFIAREAWKSAKGLRLGA